jgi:hypothetical protein
LNGRSEPKTVLECIQGDIVWVDGHGRLIITGNNQGRAKRVRIARPIDADGKEGEIVFIKTHLAIRGVERLYTGYRDGEEG